MANVLKKIQLQRFAKYYRMITAMRKKRGLIGLLVLLIALVGGFAAKELALRIALEAETTALPVISISSRRA